MAVWKPPDQYETMLHSMVKKIVLTGGTYAGKTTLLKLFEQDGFTVIPDIGFQYIAELNHSLGQDGQKAFRAHEPEKFYGEIIKMQVAEESGVTVKMAILDRGVYDYLAMMTVRGIPIPHGFYESLRENRPYSVVFVLDTLPNFSERSDSGRSLNKEDSLRMKTLLERMYTELGVKVVRVGPAPVKDRYGYILDTIKALSA